MAIGDIWKFAVKGRMPNGQEWVNVHYYKQMFNPIIATPAQVLLDDYVANVEPTFLQAMSSNMVIDGYEVRQQTGGIAALDQGSGEVGLGGAGDMLTPMDAPLISWRTGLIGRANRGRTYFPSCLEALQANGVLTTAGIAFYQTIADLHIEISDAATGLVTDWRKVIFHTDASDSPEVLTGLVRNLLATQKRRRT